ncbi:MAG TPA: PilZ domain-containing protein [Streptosporangiaceae bacterium]|nr:PilZ domain-containing protein [Streptosporangiaceae bacterium]
MTTALGEVTYLVLADRAAPYLLARVRWPDIAQAITVGCPDWLDDPGLFDLPYDPSAVTVSFPQAASIAAAWGRQLRPEAADGVPSFIRRMPANWSDLSPAERRALGIESVQKRRVSARSLRRTRRLLSAPASVVASETADNQPNGYLGAPAGADIGADVDELSASGRSQAGDGTSSLLALLTERRRPTRMRVNGRAHIRCGHATISAGLVDLGEDGMECVLPEAVTLLAPGTTLDGPVLLEAEATTSQICLDVPGRISWHRSVGAVTHFGVVFGELSDTQTLGVRHFLTAASGGRPR